MEKKHRASLSNVSIVQLCLLCLLCFMVPLFTGCGEKQAEEDREAAKMENLESQVPIDTLAEQARLFNMSVFWDWAMDKEKVVGTKEEASSRMTAFLLMQDLIQSDWNEEHGSHIAEDVDKINQYSQYEMLRPDVSTFVALFDEVSVSGMKGDQRHSAYPKAWEERGVQFAEGTAHLICVVMQTPRTEQLYIAHAAVMLEDNEGFLLIEKLGAGKQFSITYYKNKEKLRNSLLNRRDFATLMKKSHAAFLLEDDHLFEAEPK